MTFQWTLGIRVWLLYPRAVYFLHSMLALRVIHASRPIRTPLPFFILNKNTAAFMNSSFLISLSFSTNLNCALK